MGQAIGSVLPAAIGVALSPVSIIAIILMLLSPRAKKIGPVFALGCVGGTAIVTALVVLLVSPDRVPGGEGNPSNLASLITVAAGVVILFMSHQSWQKHKRGGETMELPKWMATIDKTTPLVAIGLGAMLTVVNPKNLILYLAAGTAIGQADLPHSQGIIPYVVFMIVSSLGVGIPVLWFLLDEEQASETLVTWKTWLLVNNATVMAVLLLLIGVIFVSHGLIDLFT